MIYQPTRSICTATAFVTLLVTLAGCSSTKGAADRSGGDTVTTASGLRYIDHDRGSGDTVYNGMILSVDYAGYFTDGTLFDTSIDSIGRARGHQGGTRYEPYIFVLGREEVIKGWDEGIVASMRVGGRRRLIVPPPLAYGSFGREGIPGNSTLIFDIELLSAHLDFDISRLPLRLDTVTMMNGLRYIDIEKGGGRKITNGMTVRVDYAGYLSNGKLFDTSIEAIARYRRFNRGGVPFTPIEVQLGKGDVIRGWDEGLTADMYRGGRRRLIIPPHLGYGEYGTGGIPGHSTLVFDVEVKE